MALTTPDSIRKLQTGLYTKAKAEPAFRFYLLYDKVYRKDILSHAYRLCRSNNGAPGVDRVTFEEIESKELEEWLASLGKEMHDKTYVPSPVRRVMIPKAGGGERPLGIPTIRDRVVQTAAKLVLDPIFEADYEDSAHAYRPGRSALDAVAKVERAVKDGYTDVVDADLSRYFDTIPHDQLMMSVARRVSDKHMLALIKSWLKVPVEESNGRGGTTLTGGKHRQEGTPQGGVISPLLANIYMNRFLRHFERTGKSREFRARLINYADDFVILTRGCAEKALDFTRRVMKQLGLTLNESKTSIKDARSELFDFLGYSFGPLRSRKSGRVYLTSLPSRKSVDRHKEKIRVEFPRGHDRPWDEVVTRLNRLLAGWQGYFHLGCSRSVYRLLDKFVANRVRILMRRRHKVPTRGTRQYGRQQVHETLGLLRLCSATVAA